MNETRLAVLKLGVELGIGPAELLDWAKAAADWLLDSPGQALNRKRVWSPEARAAAAERMRANRPRLAAGKEVARAASAPAPTARELPHAAPPEPELILPNEGKVELYTAPDSLDDVLRWRKREGDIIERIEDGRFKINGSAVQDLPTLLRRTNNLRRAAHPAPFVLDGVAEAAAP
jgi:hypothetical protein